MASCAGGRQETGTAARRPPPERRTRGALRGRGGRRPVRPLAAPEDEAQPDQAGAEQRQRRRLGHLVDHDAAAPAERLEAPVPADAGRLEVVRVREPELGVGDAVEREQRRVLAVDAHALEQAREGGPGRGEERVVDEAAGEEITLGDDLAGRRRGRAGDRERAAVAEDPGGGALAEVVAGRERDLAVDALQGALLS